MPVYKRGDIWWYDFTVNGERYRGSTGARKKDVAVKIEDRERESALLGSDYKQLTLAEAADLWFRAKKVGQKSALETAKCIRILLRHIPGDTLVSSIGARRITQAMNDRAVQPVLRGKNKIDNGELPANATINRTMIDSTLRPILNYASKNLEAKVKPIQWSDLRLPEPRERIRWFSDGEIAAWTAEMPHWHRPLLGFILRYGVRLKEAFFSLDAMRGDDIYTRFRKNGPQVVTLLPEDAAEMRARAGRARKAGIDTVWFREMKNGTLRPIDPRGFQSASAKALKRAGIGDTRAVHDARHHAGTMLLRKTGGNLAAVKKLLGHEAIVSTMRYAHTSNDDLRDALRHAYGTPDVSADEIPKENKAKTSS